MSKNYSKSIISAGFMVILAIILILLVVWVSSVAENKKYLTKSVVSQEEIILLSSLLESVSVRTNTAYQYIETKNRSTRNKVLEKSEIARKRIDSLVTKLNLRTLQFGDANTWSIIRVGLEKYSLLISKAMEIQMLDQNKARDLLFASLNPVHDEITERIRGILISYQNSVDQGLETAIDRNNVINYMLVLLAMAAVILGMLIVFMLRQSGRTEDALLEQGIRIRKLYEITSKPGLSIEEQIRSILKLGCDLLKMEIGKVCKIDIKKNTNSFLNVYAPKGFDVCAGTVMPLDKTFCSITSGSDEPVALHDVAKSPYGKQFSHLSAYIATQIVVNGETYGSINFSSNSPRVTPFSETDKDLLKLIGAWISSALERRFAQEELLIARNDAEAASRTKSNFLANMSHELRTPLNAIIGYSELLKEEAEIHGHDLYEPDLRKINSSALHLLTLIDDILDLSKIEAGKMELFLEDFSVGDLVNEVVGTINPLMKKRHNEFLVECKEDIGNLYADRLKVKQVLLNLLSNASKFTENGNVTLSISVETKVSASDNKTYRLLVFRVNDTGIGISDEQISKLFQAFSQAEASTTSKYGGTGLGLAISRHICQLMGGDIIVSGAIGQGSTFTVRLPIRTDKSDRRKSLN